MYSIFGIHTIKLFAFLLLIQIILDSYVTVYEVSEES